MKRTKRPRIHSPSWIGCLYLIGFVIFTLITGSPAFAAAPTYVPGGSLDPTTIPKYVIPLVIPPAMPTSSASPAPAADYDIAVRQFKQQILPGGLWNLLNGRADALPPTTIWSYGRAEDPAPDITLLGGPFAALTAGVAPAPNTSFNYPAFTVENITNVATTVRWINDLVDPVTGRYRPHLFPVDQTLHWANPPNANCAEGFPNRTDCETAIAAPYTGPVPLVTHVHGAHVQPHSDGYAQAWMLPGAPGTKGIPPSYAETGSLYNQANKTNTVPGSAFYAYENTQPASTIWYHDHALGMTRLNVVAGPAGFWLIRGGVHGDGFVDDGTTGPPNDGVLPGPAPGLAAVGDPNFDVPTGYRATIREIPVAIQDRAFNTDGSLFYPPSRAFFDGFTGPYIGGTGSPAGPSDISGIWNPETYFNTIVVNGTTWPKFEVAPARYRFRLLNGTTARTLNLALLTVTGPGIDTIYGTLDDVIGAEVPFYQIGAEQGFLPNVVKIVTGFTTTLPGNGTTPAAAAAPDPTQALLMGPAERADVIIDFTGMANGTRIRMINTGPDAPFQGFPTPAADALTTGQVMDFIVNTALTQVAPHSDATSTPPENLVLPAEAALGAATNTRQVSLNELESEQVCVEADAVTGAIVGTLFSTFPGDPTFLASCLAASVGAGNVAQPMGPRQARLGVTTLSGGNLVSVSKKWADPITEMPLLNSTEIWEIYNTTADAHPIHLHLVGVQMIDRQNLDAAALAAGNLVLSGAPTPPLPNELGYKDSVLAYPGQVTRIKARFDIPGLYVWHCHLVDHEDNEMMRPMFVNADLLYANFVGYGLFKWDGASWSQLNSEVPESMVASGSILYANFTGYGLFKWDGTSWSQLHSVVPSSMAVTGSILYANFTGYGLFKWDGTAWSKLSDALPTKMLASDSMLYARITGMGLWQWDGREWRQLAPSLPERMVVADPISSTTGPMLYAHFMGYGLWKWNGIDWIRITAGDADDIIAAGSTVYAKFAGLGLFKWDGIEWSQLHSVVPSSMAAAGAILYANFTGYGLYKWDGTSWSQLHSTVPDSMATGF
jgi:spore coat protein A